MKKNINAFNITELIVVISILIILWTVWYLSFLWYTNNAKNSAKISNINVLNNSILVYQTKSWRLPLPDNKTNISFEWESVWYQWTVWIEFLKNVAKVWDGFRDTFYWKDFAYSALSAKLDQFEIWTVVWSDITKTSYIVWNYNWKTIDWRKFTLMSPWIILSDLSNTNLSYNDLLHFATNWSENLPASYSWISLSLTWWLETAIKLWQQKLAIYYGYPSSLNYDVNARDLTKVTEDFNQYKYMVLWAGLEDTSHSDHNNMVTIVSNYIWTSYWYVSINQDYSDIVTKVDDWIDSWVDGIFLDEDWYDYLVWGGLFSNNIDAREHQNAVYDYIHSKWLKIIANWWNPDDIFWTLSWEADTTLNQVSDWYLFESFVYNVLMTPINDYRNQTDKIKSIKKYKKEYNFDLHCVWMLNKNADINEEEIETFYNNSKWFCNSIQLTNYLFSASWIDNALMINYFKDYH